jgi:large subunit ribosomal protein L31
VPRAVTRIAKLSGARGVFTLSARRIRASKHAKVRPSDLPAVKEKIHPALNPVCFTDVSTGKKFLTRSTMKSNRKETIDGVEYFVVVRDVTADSHPAYTGEKRFVDTAGRVEKFQTKFRRQRSK